MTTQVLLPPLDAPFVPGGGPRYRGPLARLRAREWTWLRWWCAVGILAVLGAAALPVGLALGLDENPIMSTLMISWCVGAACTIPPYHLGWRQGPDRYEDELTSYATGVRAEHEVRGMDDGSFELAGRRLASWSLTPRTRRRIVPVEGRRLALEESVLERTGRDEIVAVGLRLVDRASEEVVASARGDRHGRYVDWSLEMPVGGMRLRQRLDALPTRRTLLDDWGRAWRVRADADARHWSVELPTDAGPVDAVFASWFVAHLDALGMDHCYAGGAGTGPARRAGGRSGASDDGWFAIGAPPRPRPERPRGD